MDDKAKLAGTFALAATLAAGPAAGQEDVDVAFQEIPESRVLIIPGTSKATEDNQAKFTIDASGVSAMQALRANRMVVVFGGQDPVKGQLCPFFDLASRNVEVVESGPKQYTVTAEASSQEMKIVEERGCVITPRPPISQL